MRLLTDLATATLLEAAAAQHLRRQAKAYRLLQPDAQVEARDFAGGVAVLTRQDFGRKLNHVTGALLSDCPEQQAFAELEEAFARRKCPIEIDICPFVSATVLSTLSARGYVPTALNSVYTCELASFPAEFPPVPGIETTVVTTASSREFVNVSVQAFSAQDEPRSMLLLQSLAKIAVFRQDSQNFLALSAGKLVGSGSLCLVEVEGVKIALLYLGSVLPEERNRGIQRALLHARLDAARRQDAELALLESRPGHPSAYTAERVGLRLAYNKMTFAKG